MRWAAVSRAQALKEQQAKLKVQVADAERQRTEVSQQGDRRRRQAQDELDTFRDQARTFQALQDSLDRYATVGGGGW